MILHYSKNFQNFKFKCTGTVIYIHTSTKNELNFNFIVTRANLKKFFAPCALITIPIAPLNKFFRPALEQKGCYFENKIVITLYCRILVFSV